MSSSPDAKKRRRLPRVLLALGIGIVLAPLAAELSLRFLVLTDTALAKKLGEGLRKPELFADADADEAYWMLQYRFLGPERIGPAENPDTKLGWTGHLVVPGTYRHAQANEVGARTPVLLYGDSFAQCNTPADECFQAILQRSDLASKYCLLNYGVGGYGLDQIYLLIQSSVDHYRDQNPIVIVGILVESDLDRSVLDYRCWPKPRLFVREGELVESGPVDVDCEAYMREHLLSLDSLLLRFLTYHGALPRWMRDPLQAARSRIDEKKALNRQILAAIHRELESRGLRHFLLLFRAHGPIESAPWTDWQEPLIADACRDFHIPSISTLPFLLHAAGGDVNATARFYGFKGALAGHHNAQGNLVAFEAIRQGLSGDFGEPDTTHLDALIAQGVIEPAWLKHRTTMIMGREASIVARSNSSAVRYESHLGPPFNAGDGTYSLCLHGGEFGPTEVSFELDGGARRFTGTASVVARPGFECPEGVVTLSVEVDGEAVFTQRCKLGTSGIRLSADLEGKRVLKLVVEHEGRMPECTWVAIMDPRIE